MHPKIFEKSLPVLCLAVIAIAVLGAIPSSAAVVRDPDTVGWVERVLIGAQRFVVNAKLDTGADTSSLNAGDIEVYSRGEKFWVRFTVTNFRNEMARFDLPVRRFVKIKRHGGRSVERPVIEIDLCLGRISRLARVTLADRSKFKYAALIGREFLSAGKKVDSARKFLMEPDCK